MVYFQLTEGENLIILLTITGIIFPFNGAAAINIRNECSTKAASLM